MIVNVRDSEHPGSPEEALAGLTREQRELAMISEQRWRQAHSLADAHAGMDPSDVYHALRCLELSIHDRLRLGLRRGRLRSDAR